MFVRLERLDRENAQRAELDARYRAHFAELGLECPLAPSDGLQSAHHLFCVLLAPEIDRRRLRDTLVERRVQTSMHYPPVHRFSIYADGAPHLPVTDDYARRAVTLPMFAHMTSSQQELVVEAVGSALAQQRARAHDVPAQA